ncbi:uncharacterized protein LOC133203377 [Saccostrea echinata]|uniref:uncharacterized protein LOC133203377 n=1 Tax=Saccostrea echinata TaxID=191078 RepID=UPI002A838E62|nr:uncharacterized protein LOC133203377 [Saccostrea echinata]
MSSTAQSTLSAETPNTKSIDEFDTIIAGLKVHKVNTSAFRRSLTCAYDPRQSSMAIGSSGVSVISLRIQTLFISDWFDVSVNGTSPILIPHFLNEIPAKVDLQVQVVHGGKPYIFPGIGSTQRDDDIAAEYGGVAFLYNTQHLKVFVSVAKEHTRGYGRIITTGGGSYSGPFSSMFVTGKVRTRVWRLPELPTPIFSITSGLSISTDFPYQHLTVCFGTYPDLVTVQLVFNDGYVTEGTGVTPVTADDTGTNNICGVVFGVTQTSITLWAPSKNEDMVACFCDGWGSENLR